MFDIGAVLEHYSGAAPPHRGGWAPMKCPFHADSSPSAAVNYGEGRFHCFVCGIHEDAVGLVREREHCGFQDAVKIVEEITGQSRDPISDQSELGGWFPGRARNNTRVGGKGGAWRSGLAATLT